MGFLVGKRNTEYLRLVLVGCGRHATAVLHTALGLMKEIKVVACCDKDEERAIFTARRFGLSEYYTDIDDMLSKVTADAAVVVTFPALQSKLITKCLEAGMHVYSEKPLAVELDEAYKILDIAKKNNVYYGIGFNKRFSPYYQNMKEAISSSVFGAPSLFYAKFAGGYRPRTTDLLRVGAIHMFDLSRFLIGEVKEVSSYMYEKEPGQASITANIMFENGCIGVYILSSLGLWSAKGMEYVEARGDQNIYWVDSCRQSLWQKPPLSIEAGMTTQNRKEIPSPAEYLEPNYSDISYIEMQSFHLNGYFQAIQAFASSILNNKKPNPGVEDGIQSLKIAMAIEESAKTGKSIAIE
ncbi:MAG: Gfo/Idh/MocA family protein [Clostridia bacterium]